MSQTHALTLSLTEEERTELLALLEYTLGETRVEVHHTHTPAYRDQAQHREAIVRSLIEKVRHAVA